MNTFDDDNELGLFDEPRARRPRRERRPQRNGSRRRPSDGSSLLRLAGLIALAIAIAFGFVLWISSCGGGTKQGYEAYFDAMRPLAQESASVGDEFAQKMLTQGLTMESLQSDLASWSRLEQADYVAAQRLQPPGPLQSAHAEALAAFQLRANSLSYIASTLTLAQEKHDSSFAAGAALASDAQLLSASDVIWEQLYKLAATQILKGKVPGVIVPASQIVTSGDIVSAHQLAIVYQRVGTPSSGGNVTGRHGSNLVGTNAVYNGITTALSTSTQTTVNVASSVVLDVVFEDSGAFPEVQVPVTVTITVGDEVKATKTKKVSQIGAGEQRTVAFTISLPPDAYKSATITVTVKRVKGETELSNNKATYPVLFQLAP